MTSFAPHSLPPHLVQMMGDIEANLASRARALAGRVQAVRGGAFVDDPMMDLTRPLETGDHVSFETTIGCEQPDGQIDIEFKHGAQVRIDGPMRVTLCGWFPGQVGVRPDMATSGRLIVRAGAHSGLSILVGSGHVRLSAGVMSLEIWPDHSCHVVLRSGQASWSDSSNTPPVRIVPRRPLVVSVEGSVNPVRRPEFTSWRMTSLGVAAVLVAAMAMHIGHSLGSGSAQGGRLLSGASLMADDAVLIAVPVDAPSAADVSDRAARSETTATAVQVSDPAQALGRSTQANGLGFRRVAPVSAASPRSLPEPYLPEEYILWQSLQANAQDVALAGSERSFHTSAVRQPQPAMAGEGHSAPTSRRTATDGSVMVASEVVMTGSTLPAARAVPTPDDFIGGDMIHFFVK